MLSVLRLGFCNTKENSIGEMTNHIPNEDEPGLIRSCCGGYSCHHALLSWRAFRIRWLSSGRGGDERGKGLVVRE